MLDDCASAFCTLIAPPGLLLITSPPSFDTSNDSGMALAGSVVDRTSGSVSGGTYSVGLAFRMLVWTFMPSETAVASTYGLNEDPTCSRE